jgi:hypothetical protein
MSGHRLKSAAALFAGLMMAATLLAPSGALAATDDKDEVGSTGVSVSVMIEPLPCKGREVPASGPKARPGRPDQPGCKGSRPSVCIDDPWFGSADPLRCGQGPKDPQGPKNPQAQGPKESQGSKSRDSAK